LIKNTVSSIKTPSRGKSKSKVPMNDPSHGVEATIIDLGLARMNGGEEVHWTPFDDEIFEGEGDYQFDVYRMMKGGVGEEYRPITNVMVSVPRS
jgi:serine/threonine-protein kinase haspin